MSALCRVILDATNSTAILGPSGSGKTSLLDILAGRASTNAKITINADIRLNNFSVDPSNIEVRKKIAFVSQDDSLQVTATPREAIKFSAKLRLPRTMTVKALENLTETMLDELGLQNCADVLVGTKRDEIEIIANCVSVRTLKVRSLSFLFVCLVELQGGHF